MERKGRGKIEEQREEKKTVKQVRLKFQRFSLLFFLEILKCIFLFLFHFSVGLSFGPSTSFFFGFPLLICSRLFGLVGVHFHFQLLSPSFSSIFLIPKIKCKLLRPRLVGLFNLFGGPFVFNQIIQIKLFLGFVLYFLLSIGIPIIFASLNFLKFLSVIFVLSI